MIGLTLDDHAESDDAGRGLQFDDGAHRDRDFKCARDPDEVHPGLGKVVSQFVDDEVDEGIGIALVVFGRDDGHAVARGAEDPGFSWEGSRHGKGL